MGRFRPKRPREPHNAKEGLANELLGVPILGCLTGKAKETNHVGQCASGGKKSNHQILGHPSATTCNTWLPKEPKRLRFWHLD